LEVSGQLHAPAVLPQGKEPPVPIGWAPEPVWTTWRRQNSCTNRNSNSDPSVLQAVASSLYRLNYPGEKYNIKMSFLKLQYVREIIIKKSFVKKHGDKNILTKKL
jgi:hypothetical protein